MDKKRDVLLTVVGKQNYGSYNDKVELTTIGSFVETEGCYVLEYEEAQEQRQPPVQVRVQVCKNKKEVQMERTGDGHSCLLIKQGSRSQCSYDTEYGDMIMGLFGKKIDFTFSENQGVFDFRYTIDMNGQVTSRNQVKINFREK